MYNSVHCVHIVLEEGVGSVEQTARQTVPTRKLGRRVRVVTAFALCGWQKRSCRPFGHVVYRNTCSNTARGSRETPQTRRSKRWVFGCGNRNGWKQQTTIRDDDIMWSGGGKFRSEKKKIRRRWPGKSKRSCGHTGKYDGCFAISLRRGRNLLQPVAAKTNFKKCRYERDWNLNLLTNRNFRPKLYLKSHAYNTFIHIVLACVHADVCIRTFLKLKFSNICTFLAQKLAV